MLCNRTLLGIVAACVMLIGCRSYGDYGSQEAMYRHIHLAVDEFEAAQADFDARHGALSGRAPADELDRLAVRRADLVLEYRSVLDRIDESTGHRELRRIYGSVISDRQILEDRLARFEQVAAADTLPSPTRAGAPRSQYQIVPVYYHRIGTLDHEQRDAVTIEAPDDPTESDEIDDLDDDDQDGDD